MINANTAGEFMVREPICASLWQPISFIRQQMLKYSFTYLPLSSGDEDQEHWWLVSDYGVANYLRQGDRKTRLAKTLGSAIEEGFKREQANICYVDCGVREVLKKSNGKPVVVVDGDHSARLVGIVTPFDLL